MRGGGGGGNGDEVEMLAQEEAFKFVMQKKKIQTALVKQLLPTVLKTLARIQDKV